MYFQPFFFSACNELICASPSETCYEYFDKTQDATCDCSSLYLRVNGTCITSENIVEVAGFKLNVTFQQEFTDMTNAKTIKFTNELAESLHITLGLDQNEYVKITKLTKGSIYADFIVLLRNETVENKTTIFMKLEAEVRDNTTGNLEKYFPIADQLLVIVGRKVQYFLS